jgi:hypothetical protein
MKDRIINEAVIIYLGQRAWVKCDRRCSKAWGIALRPYERLSNDEDDIVYMADGELGVAPDNPGTYEGRDGKPSSPNDFPNKWCVRQCERSAMTAPGEDHETLKLLDWSKRVYNQPRKHLDKEDENETGYWI